MRATIRLVGFVRPDVAVNRDQKIAAIQRQLDAVTDGEVEDVNTWKHTNEVVLRTSLGETNPTYQKLVKVSFTPAVYFDGMKRDAYTQARRRGISSSVSLMKAAIGEIELLEPKAGEMTAPGGTRVFIVHGRSEVRKLEVAELVRDLTGTKAAILSEYPNSGRTLIEKFEHAASEAAYAIVIASADDEGRLRGEDELQSRARQNVIFELGYFIGKLGRSRVALLFEEGVETPSDAQGIAYIPLDRNNGWKLPLAKELNNAGVAVDFQALAN